MHIVELGQTGDTLGMAGFGAKSSDCRAFALILATSLSLPADLNADVRDATARARAGDFSASGEVNCAQEVGERFGMCLAKVARDDGTAAAVVVTFPNGFARVLTFEGGEFLRGNTTMSGVGTDTDWFLDNGVYRIRVDDQRFEIPEALISGN